MKATMENKDTVGAISGYYDDKLSIAEVSESFLNNLGLDMMSSRRLQEALLERFSAEIIRHF